MRRLSLHASALNDDEYDLYTSSIEDLALCDPNPNNVRDDTFYERLTLGVREVRAWLRGRYRDTPVNTIDAVLKLFSPTLSPADTLSGGEFFAVLRLVLHAQSGKSVDRTLVFVQAHPPSTNALDSGISAGPQRRSIDSSALSITSEPPPPAPNPFSGQQPPLHPSQRQDTPKHVHSPNNPFVVRSKSISARSENGSSRLPPLPPLPPRKPSAPLPPPRHASGSSLKSPRIIHPAIDHAPSPTQSHQHLHPPPPPPPKSKPVTHVTSPLIKRSLQASKVAQTIKQVEDERGKERVLQVLRSSAVGSGSSVRNHDSSGRSPAKKAPGSLPLPIEAKSDSSASLSGGDERERPPLPKRPRQLQAPSPSMSATSLEQVALATVPSGSRSHPATPFTRSPFESPTLSPRSSLDSPSLPPPTHPDRKPYQPYHPSTQGDNQPQPPHSATTSPSPLPRNLESFEAVYGPSRRSLISSMEALNTLTPSSDTIPEQSRVLRSKSLHQYKPYIPPPPPPARRKRPESVQVLTNGQVFFGVGPSNDSNNALKNSITQSPSKAHRRASYSSSFGGSAASAPASMSLGGGGTDAIHRKLAELQLKAENALPKLEAARYKAEAGISRRGFIQGSPSQGREKSNSRSEDGRQEDREGLMSGYDGDQYGDQGGSEGEVVERNGLSVDSGDESRLRGRKEDRNGIVRERDDSKWPVGEGWKEL